jgi:hypothetical protein
MENTELLEHHDHWMGSLARDMDMDMDIYSRPLSIVLETVRAHSRNLAACLDLEWVKSCRTVTKCSCSILANIVIWKMGLLYDINI